MSSEYDETAFELRSVGDELIVMDLETHETHLLNAEAATAFRALGMDRRALLKGGAFAGALVGAGAIQTILAPPAAANSSGIRMISGSGSCSGNSGNVTVTIAGDGFFAGSVVVSITYAVTGGGTSTVTGTFQQPKTGPLTGSLALKNVASGTKTATITATDSNGTGTTITGSVSLTGC